MYALPERHIVTRSLKATRYRPAEFIDLSLSETDVVVIASDGFWAELDVEKQMQFFAGTNPNSKDDCSYLCISATDVFPTKEVDFPANYTVEQW